MARMLNKTKQQAQRDAKKADRKSDWITDMGIVRSKHSLLWGYEDGHLRWTPFWVRELIVKSWNKIACRLFDHYILNEFDFQEDGVRFKDPKIVCVHCCQQFTQAEYESYVMRCKERQAV